MEKLKNHIYLQQLLQLTQLYMGKILFRYN